MEENYRECKDCAKKSRSPELCETCIHNRNVSMAYKERIFKLEKTLEIIKELIGLQGIY